MRAGRGFHFGLARRERRVPLVRSACHPPFAKCARRMGHPTVWFVPAEGWATRPAYGNYVYGVYMQAAGVPLSLALSAANVYGNRKNFGTHQWIQITQRFRRPTLRISRTDIMRKRTEQRVTTRTILHAKA